MQRYSVYNNLKVRDFEIIVWKKIFEIDSTSCDDKSHHIIAELNAGKPRVKQPRVLC